MDCLGRQETWSDDHLARTAQRCVMTRAASLADLGGLDVRAGPGWRAVRGGAHSNDVNVVVGERGFVPDAALVRELGGWFGELPASWLVEQPDEALTTVLLEAGWTAERTGRWCGRLLPADEVGPTRAVEVVEVDPVSGLADWFEDWLDVARSCGWWDDPADLDVRRRLAAAVAPDPRRAAWMGLLDGRPVGMATSWCADGTLMLVDVAVRPESRRRGVGSALVVQVLAWGAGRGATSVVAEPSPDGWGLLATLGFTNVPVVPDACFYWVGGTSPPTTS